MLVNNYCTLPFPYDCLQLVGENNYLPIRPLFISLLLSTVSYLGTGYNAPKRCFFYTRGKPIG